MADDAATPPTEAEANRALVTISIAVLLASATWFSGTAAVGSLAAEWSLGPGEAASLTTSVQLGFIIGTVLYAALNLADVFNPRRVFFVSAVLGAALNAGFATLADGLAVATVFRFLTGVTLAGVYPVGMKIVATWFERGLGWRLGVMVGALTFGTATPYLLQALGTELVWRIPVGAASVAATLGGVAALTLRDGPLLRERVRFDLLVALRAFRHAPFRNTALGYFGHMWELYAVWALIGFFVSERMGPDDAWSSWIAFAVVAAGALGCIGGGWISRRVGERRVAVVSLLASAAACLVSGYAFTLSIGALTVFLVLWGVVIVSDSPQFSALAARHAPPGYTGTALTVQNGIGFAVTIGSLQLLPVLASDVGWRWAFMVLAIGPLIGAAFVNRVPDESDL